MEKRGSTYMFGRGQVATEHLILTGIILVLVIPILFFVSKDQTNTPYMADAVNTIDKAVESLSNLGIGSSDTVVVNIPGDVFDVEFLECSADKIKCKAIKITYGSGKEDVFEMKYLVGGSIEFFKQKGIHYVTLFNDGDNQQIVFQECGDGYVNGGEQCEPCITTADCHDADQVCSNGVCTIDGFIPCGKGCFDSANEFGCFCQCQLDIDCPYGICTNGVCSGCENDGDCNPGEYCLGGACQSCDKDEDEDEFQYSLSCSSLDCNDLEPNENKTTSQPEGTQVETCSDLYDNDCDGLVDCQESLCGGTTSCPGPGLCGNDNIDFGEECDDGNAISGDGCNKFCENEICSETNSYSIVQVFSTFNSHLSLLPPTFPEIPGGTCFNLTESLVEENPMRTCTGTNTVMYITGTGDNAHFTPPDIGPLGSEVEVCYGDLECESISASSSCADIGVNYDCILSFKAVGGSQANAHVSDCSEPTSSYKLCCQNPS